MRNITACSVPAGEDLYFSPRDFSSAYLANTQLTLAGMPYAPVSAQFISTTVTTFGGATTTYPASSYYHSYAAGVLTVAGANFITGATADVSYVVTVRGPVRAYNIAGDYQRVGEIDALDSHSEIISLVDTTNLAAAANEYPSANGLDMLGRNYFSLNGQLIEADAGMNISVKVYGSNDEEAVGASKVWSQLYGKRVDIGGAEVNAIICPTSNVIFAWEFYCRFRFIKVVVQPDHAASNTVVVKMHLTALG